jgi:hypothetical protein
MNAQTYSGKVGFNRASRRNPCPICGAKKYCGVTRDGRLAHCMYVDTGSIKIAKDGGYLHLLIDDRCDLTQISKQQHIKKQVTSELSTLAPLEVRHAVYSRLIELSPSWKYEAELIQGMDGLLRRGLTSEDIVKFGALPSMLNLNFHLIQRRKTIHLYWVCQVSGKEIMVNPNSAKIITIKGRHLLFLI